MVDCLALFSCCRVANTLSSAWVVPRPAIAPKQSSRHLLFIFLRVRCWVQFEYDLHAALDNMIPLFSLMVRPLFPGLSIQAHFCRCQALGNTLSLPICCQTSQNRLLLSFSKITQSLFGTDHPVPALFGFVLRNPAITSMGVGCSNSSVLQGPGEGGETKVSAGICFSSS